MQPQWIDHFLHQTRIAMHISERDAVKRMASMFLMVGVSFAAGAPRAGILIGVWVIVVEIIGHILVSLMAKQDSSKSLKMALGFWTNNCLSVLPYLAFSILLSLQDSLAYLLAGYIWLFGIYVQTSNSFGMLPYYNWSLMTPAFGTAFILLFNSDSHSLEHSTTFDWLVVSFTMIAYIIATLETMNNQKDTVKALARARAEANAQLKELEYLTRHDKLTGLMNRHAFDDGLAQMLENAQSRGGVTMFLIDLDDFKPINDSYSHLAGDTVLTAVAENLARVAGPEAIVARLGGDEFAAAVPNLPSDAVAVKLGTYIVRAIEAPVSFEQKKLRVGASLGIARTTETLRSANELCTGADQAMYRAKADPGTSVVLYNKTEFPMRLTLEDRQILYSAIQDNQITPYYQPKVSLHTGAVVGLEALARWDHPERGTIAPADFLPMITEFGLHGDLVLHMAQQVLTDMETIVAQGLDCGQISINVPEVTLATLSGRSELAALIDRYAHLRKHLTFEITEDVFIARSGDMIQRTITFFRQSGIRVSLDDFGTGFASFQHLRELEFDELKLDTSFVQGLGVDNAAGVLVENFLSIGKGLGVQVVAEGVETNAQLIQLRQMGCDVAQGHLFGAAMPLDAAISLMRSGVLDPDARVINAA